jgi:hypothetical protein
VTIAASVESPPQRLARSSIRKSPLWCYAGVGALYNWPRTQQVFGNIRVDLIDDSGTLMPADVSSLRTGGSIEPTWRASWNITSQFTPHANLKIFESASSGHVLFFNPTISQGPATEQQFITKMVTDDSTWSTVTP